MNKFIPTNLEKSSFLSDEEKNELDSLYFRRVTDLPYGVKEERRIAELTAKACGILPHIKQTKMDSFMEALTNTLVGYLVAVAANFLILPLFGFNVKVGESLLIAALFTIVSIIRSYILRRLFNGRSMWAALKGKFS